jgi:hypothetical protein
LTVTGLTELRLSVPEAGRRLLPLPVAAWHATVGARTVDGIAKGDAVLVHGQLSGGSNDLGRASVPRRVLAELLAEREEEEARGAAQQAQQAAARRTPVAVGVPALDGASPYESMVAAGGVVTPSQEFGGGRTSVHQEVLDERLDEGRKHAADAEAEAEAIAGARKLLDGRDK